MILVTGANGRLGLQVVRLLAGAGFPVRCLIRKGSAYWWLNGTGARYRFGDLRDMDSLHRACEGVTHLIACSGVTRQRRDNHHRNATSQGHANLWQAALKAGVKRVVFVSCIGADESLQRSGLEHVILRPSIYVEELARLALLAKSRGFLVLPGPGTNQVAPISVRDVALRAVSCLDLEGVEGRVIPLGGPETLPMKEALQRALQAAEAPNVRQVAAPAALVDATSAIIRPANWRWSDLLQDMAPWFQVAMVPDAPDPTGLPLESLGHALGPALAEERDHADPDARIQRSNTRTPLPTGYKAGTAQVAMKP